MFFPEQEHLVYNIKLSSVGPGRVTGSDVVHELGGLDLAMKLHYLKGVYFFSNQAVKELTIVCMKETMFYWLNDYYISCGRIKRTEEGRPYIKCNDCGIRFVEAVCDKTVEEWLEIGDDSLHNLLVYNRAIGPDLSFSPLVYLQVTRFKCGGISLGMSWAHILGDAFSACDFINSWGQYMAKLKHNEPLTLPKPLAKIEKSADQTQLAKDPLSAKQVNPVGDLWITANNCQMVTFSFYLSTIQLSTLQAKLSGEDGSKRISSFESVCAVIWQCIAKVRQGFEPQTVTVCRKHPHHDNNVPSNSQIISAIKADFSVMDADLRQLALLLADDQALLDERNKIEAAMEKDNGLTDYIVYGINLTFVNLEDAKLYELELKGKKPRFVYYSIQGVGEEGVVLFLPGPPKGSSIDNEGKERLITITLPEDQLVKLKTELGRIGLLLPSELE